MADLHPYWSELLYGINPYAWANIGIAMALGMSIAGAAWYDSLQI